ncbi:MAG: LysR family transcriptional regulator [Marinobacter sp.]
MKENRLLEMRIFKAVVDAGGFTAAAHLLGVSQPFVSQTMTSLERRLGVQLIHRSTRGHRLTGEGEQFLSACGRILNEIELAEAQVSSARSKVSGELRISAPLAFGLDQIVPLLPEAMADQPNVVFHLALSDSIANLIEDNVDVAIRMGRLTDSSLKSRKLCDLQRLVVAAPSYLEAHGLPQTPADLRRHNCLMWEGPRDHLNRWSFRIDGTVETLLASGNFRSSNGLTLFELCTAGVGIMRLAEHLALPAIREGKLVPLLSDHQVHDDTAISAVFLPERELLPRIRNFVDYLVEAFRQPPWSE